MSGPLSSFDVSIFQNVSLSSDARALYALLLSYPSSWIPRKTHLAKQLRWGRNKTTRALSELRKIAVIGEFQLRDPISGQVNGRQLVFLRPRSTGFGYVGVNKQDLR